MIRRTFWDKKIPTLLGLIFIIFGIGLTSFLVNKGVIFTGQAGPSQVPDSIKITNVSDTSFTVSYTTEDNVFGSVNYGPNPAFGQTAFDDRDSISKSVTPHKLHSISVNNLEPQTTYYFSITSAENKYLNNGEPFSVKTAPSIESSPSAQRPMSGKVLLPNGSPPKEAIIYLSADGGQTISSFIRSDGTYLLPLNSMRNSAMDAYFEFNENTTLKMTVTGDSLTSNILLSVNQINPVPTITLSNNYDFYSGEDIASESAAPISSTFPDFEIDTSEIFNPTIESPSQDEAFTDSQPNFEGKALPNETVEITIESDPITATITSDANGNWQFRPSTPLSSGNHTITIKTRDSTGIIKTITQNFTVYAEGTQIADTSTTKATLSITPTPPPTSSPSLSPSPTSSPNPTSSPIPTQILPTPTPVILTASPTPVTTSLLPTGDSKTFAVGVLGIGIVIIGGLIFVLTRGQIPL